MWWNSIPTSVAYKNIYQAQKKCCNIVVWSKFTAYGLQLVYFCQGFRETNPRKRYYFSVAPKPRLKSFRYWNCTLLGSEHVGNPPTVVCVCAVHHVILWKSANENVYRSWLGLFFEKEGWGMRVIQLVRLRVTERYGHLVRNTVEEHTIYICVCFVTPD